MLLPHGWALQPSCLDRVVRGACQWTGMVGGKVSQKPKTVSTNFIAHCIELSVRSGYLMKILRFLYIYVNTARHKLTKQELTFYNAGKENY